MNRYGQQQQKQQRKSTLAFQNSQSASSSGGSKSHRATTATSTTSASASAAAAVRSKQSSESFSSSSSLSWQQIQSIMLSSAVPMIGFGFMDNFIMIQAGSYIDNTIGVQLGLATMTAAALGQIVSDTCGVIFGGTLERFLSIQPIQLSKVQQSLRLVPQLRLMGAVLGVMLGCSLGAVVGISIGGSATQTDDDDEESSSSIHQLQNILDDIMTNQQEIWYKQHCTCTLFVNAPVVNNNNATLESSNSRVSTIRSLQSSSSTDTTESASLAKQCAESSAIISSENTIYIPILNKNDSSKVLGVMKIEQPTNYSSSNVLNSTAMLDDAKVVARTVGYFMTHVVKMD